METARICTYFDCANYDVNILYDIVTTTSSNLTVLKTIFNGIVMKKKKATVFATKKMLFQINIPYLKFNIIQYKILSNSTDY